MTHGERIEYWRQLHEQRGFQLMPLAGKMPVKGSEGWQAACVTGRPFDGVFKVKFDRLKEWGLVEETDAVVRLTPFGAFFADEVVQQFEHPSFLPFPMEAYGDGPLNPYKDNEASDALPSS